MIKHIKIHSSLISSPHQRAQVLSCRLSFVVLCKCRSIVPCIFLVKPRVYLHVPFQRRPILALWRSARPHITSEPPSERRNIVSIVSTLSGSWGFLTVHVRSNFRRRSASFWILHVPLVSVWSDHWFAAFWNQNFNVFEEFSKTDSVNFLDLKHRNENSCKIFTKIVLNETDFLEKWIEVDLKPFIVVNLIQSFHENHFDDHDSKGKDVCLFEVNSGVLVILWQSNH